MVIQILEGENSAVSWLYDRIARDPRHAPVVKLLDRPIAKRDFAGWPMRLITIDDLAKRERWTVLNALESADLSDVLAAVKLPTDALVACPWAITEGVFRARYSSPVTPHAGETVEVA